MNESLKYIGLMIPRWHLFRVANSPFYLLSYGRSYNDALQFKKVMSCISIGEVLGKAAKREAQREFKLAVMN